MRSAFQVKKSQNARVGSSCLAGKRRRREDHFWRAEISSDSNGMYAGRLSITESRLASWTNPPLRIDYTRARATYQKCTKRVTRVFAPADESPLLQRDTPRMRIRSETPSDLTRDFYVTPNAGFGSRPWTAFECIGFVNRDPEQEHLASHPRNLSKE